MKMAVSKSSRRAFTLIEIMMVVAILGLIVAMGIPTMLTAHRHAPLVQAVNDVIDICSNARAKAILNSTTTLVIFHPQSRQVSISQVPAADDTNDSGSLTDGTPDNAQTASSPQSVDSTQFDDRVSIDMLYINLMPYTDADEARVRFFPNGTSDEMTLVLHSGDQYQKISLEVTTGLATVQPIR
ncbi:MAG TPA: prepilin-type N-terminal cleavage/methylation domain-containing protein [Verrucomicrobiae bacterium]|nr:prepilin-type N-terminal cleavage/methylation domain-containing protein [Verrucomicrobiae bacterium]